MQQDHLTDPDLDSSVDVGAQERDGRFMATADLDEDSRFVGSGTRPRGRREPR